MKIIPVGNLLPNEESLDKTREKDDQLYERDPRGLSFPKLVTGIQLLIVQVPKVCMKVVEEFNKVTLRNDPFDLIIGRVRNQKEVVTTDKILYKLVFVVDDDPETREWCTEPTVQWFRTLNIEVLENLGGNNGVGIKYGGKKCT